MSTRREFTRAMRSEMLRRSMRGNRIHCEGCGRDLTGKRVEFDHTIPEALILDKTRPLTAADGQVLGLDCCHRAPGGKTAQDVADIARAKRREVKHAGIRKSLKGQPLPAGAPALRASTPLSKPLPPRRRLYAPERP